MGAKSSHSFQPCLVLLFAGRLRIRRLGRGVAVRHLRLRWTVDGGRLGGAGGTVGHLLGRDGLLHVRNWIDWTIARLGGVVGAWLGMVLWLLRWRLAV